MKTIEHDVDFCVVGGGMAGLCAAVAAARRGTRTLLMHDRPVLGGNASSEIRMWICGAQGPNLRETGILEEINLENRRCNPSSSYAIWDAILYGKAAYQENLTLLLNCSCLDATMDGARIQSITGWQLTTETRHVVRADLFADCSGDSILAPLSGAEFRWGREAASEFGEDIAPEKADGRTMGMSCLLQARETDRPQPFIPPPWAHQYGEDDPLLHPRRTHDLREWSTNFWWIEVGGEGDTIHDTEVNRDELLRIVYGVWDHIKNRGDHGADNWMLEWVGFLPGKRESRRYVGDHILTQGDVRAEGRFPDIVAYGGWPMDDHPPAGFRHTAEPTTFHKSPSPYGIPYRCLYSRNIENLYFAGRNISTTHTAMTSTRVMATCAVVGQAVGTAAAMACVENLSPRDIGRRRMEEVQQALLRDDCYLPWKTRTIGEAWLHADYAASEGDPEPLRSGVDRTVDEQSHAWSARPGASLTITFDSPSTVRRLRLVFDSDLTDKSRNMPSVRPLDYQARGMPPTLIRDFRIDVCGEDERWSPVSQATDNDRRLVFVPFEERPIRRLRLTLDRTWGAAEARVFAVDGE